MNNRYENLEFRTVSLKGSHYEIGKQLAMKLANYKRFRPRLISKKISFTGSKFRNINEILELYDSYCPGIIDEMQGFADESGNSLDCLSIFDIPKSRQYNCSQFAVLGKKTENGSTYIGRSYDYHYSDEDLILMKTKVNHKYSHIGFSMNGFGRPDGINSSGLVITMAGGGAWDAPWTNLKSFHYYIAIRSLLDNCKSVDEAVGNLIEMPVCTSTNYLIVDTSHKAALVEGFDSTYEVKFISDESPESFLYSTNYYKQKKMEKYNKFINPWLMECNKAREKALKKILENRGVKISKESLKTLIKNEIPDGLSSLYFEEWFGTLWSMFFDLDNRSVEVCFGPPSLNPYHYFSLDKDFEEKKFEVDILNKKSNFLSK